MTTDKQKQEWYGRDVVVLSDLHIGDGSSKDNLRKGDNEKLLLRLLDKVESTGAKLVILGDLFELWGFHPHAVVQRWQSLLDRLSGMDVVYVPGNHDWEFWKDRTYWQGQHPFFETLHRPFSISIGTRHFQFLHGHEVDPTVPEYLDKLKPILRMMTSTLEFRSDTCLASSDTLTDLLSEGIERVLSVWHYTSRQFNRTIHEHLGLTDDGWRRLIRPIRTRNMIARYYRRQQQGFYDVTITGHTHKAGRFGNWYFNCGSWTQSRGQYLHIDPAGEVVVNDWTLDGNKVNLAVVLK